MRALISVYDKTDLEDFGRGLESLGAELVASGGTAAYLEERGLSPARVDELTDVPELLGGRVKTLHPRIHAAILARRERDDDLAALEEHEIEPFDLVCVNLYPFLEVATRYGTKEHEAVEMIDIGGPTLLRGAAKNFAHVAAVSRPDQYGRVLHELRETGGLSLETRRQLAAEAFATTAVFEAAVARWFADVASFPDVFTPVFTKFQDLAYGENPHQRAAYYAEAGARRHLLSRVEQLHGKDLSFNNLADLSAARACAAEFTLACCVVVKHGNPCGVAVAATIEEAYERALACDPLSAYGGGGVLNRRVGPEVCERVAKMFVEGLLAPRFDDAALDALRAKPGTRILADTERRQTNPGERDYRRVLGGGVVQEPHPHGDERPGVRARPG